MADISTIETIAKIVSIFALVTGVPYMIFEVLQKNIMWYFGLATSAACIFSFALQSNWASMGLNIYYLFMSIWGLIQWRKDARKLKAMSPEKSIDIHLNRLTPKLAIFSAAAFAAMLVLLIWILGILGDQSVVLDALSTSISIIAMIWLAKSIRYHWYLWIIGDTCLVIMCYTQGDLWLSLMYIGYIAASMLGISLWKKHGRYVDASE